MTKSITTAKPKPSAAWTKQLHTGEEGSAWRVGAEIIDREMKSARKVLDAAKLPYVARDLVRLTEVLFDTVNDADDLAALARARLDCEAIPYGAGDLIEMMALFAEGVDRTAHIMAEDEAEHMEVCADCAGQARH